MIDYRILPEHKLMVVCNWGMTSLADVQNMRQVYRTDPDYSPHYDAYVDMSRIGVAYTVEEIKTYAKRFIILVQTVKVAVFSPDESTHDMLRIFSEMTASKYGGDIRPFRSKTEAMKWLGRENVDIESMCEHIMANCRFEKSVGLQ